jgi:hypothetical protein
MSTKLEMIEMLRKRINVSFEEANEALERCNGDVLAALIYLEKNQKINAEQEKKHNNGYAIIRWFKDIIRKGNRTKLAIIKDAKVKHSVPLTLLVLVTVIAPHLTVIAFLIALFTEHRFEIIKANGETMEIKKAFDEVVTSVNKAGKEVVVQDNVAEDNTIKL